jgi:hypothetical protein
VPGAHDGRYALKAARPPPVSLTATLNSSGLSAMETIDALMASAPASSGREFSALK